MLSSGTITALSTDITSTALYFIKSTWRALPTLPQMNSTAATLCGELVVIGGGFEESSLDCIVGQKWVDDIYWYYGYWEKEVFGSQ